ncbi:MAG: response regulator [Pseudomonadales bacterium]|nr:response regulator [Pseudomonadales bacterium]
MNPQKQPGLTHQVLLRTLRYISDDRARFVRLSGGAAAAGLLLFMVLVSAGNVSLLWLLPLFTITLLCSAALIWQADQLAMLADRQPDLSRMSDTLQAVVDIYWHWDLRTGEFQYQGQLKDLLGYPTETRSTADFWRTVIHPIDRPLQKYHLLRHLRDESKPYYCEYRLKDASGEYQWFAGKGKVIEYSKSGEPLLMVGSLDHIQHRKDLERNLIQAHKMEAIGQLTGGIAHDFNNILASVLGYTELALDTEDKARVNSYLEQIHQGGTRARNVVRQLLDFSRSSRSETQVVNLAVVIHESVQMLRSTLPTSISLKESYPDDQCNTRLDPNQFQRVLVNLCINARDAMEARGELEIELATELAGPFLCSSCHSNFEGEYHVIRVTDNGKGVDKNIQSRLFEPFFTTKDIGQGSGMGLSVVHGITHDYHGHLRFVSQPGRGTQVSLYFLPVRQNADADPEETAALPEALNRKILLVDDERPITLYLTELFHRHGCDVTSTQSAEKALSLINENPDDFDLVITDQTMPGMTGTELATILNNSHRELPLILCSGFGVKTGQCPPNVKKVLQKPVDRQIMVNAVAELTRGQY